MRRSAVLVRFNETCALRVAVPGEKPTSLVISKGYLTKGHSMLRNGQSAEVYRDARFSVSVSRTGDDSLDGIVFAHGGGCVQILGVFACAGTRFVGQGAVAGMETLGLHFARHVRLRPSAGVARALLAAPCSPPPGARLRAARAALGPVSLDFCRDAPRNAFASLYHFNRATMHTVAAAGTRPGKHVQTELALVACLFAALAAETAAAPARGVWCTRLLRRVALAAPAAEPTLRLTVQTPLGVRCVRGVLAPDASYWLVAGDVLRVPASACDAGDAFGAGDAESVPATVSALRAAAAGRRRVASVPYVRQHACLRGMSVHEVALSLLCNDALCVE